MTTPGQMGPVLYNPALLRREELIGSFVVRHGELQELVDRVRSAPAEHAPQHVLILGWRGMGKTTLLHRLAYAVEDDPDLGETWLPVLFDEEQLNVGELADFWLNALEMLSIAADDRTIKERADRLSTTLKERELEEAAYEALAESARRLCRRLLLLVDNVDLVLSRIDPDREASRLREILQHEPWLMLVGTSSRAIESTYDYGQPFYEMFRILELAPLDERQTLDMLAGLAERYDAPDVGQVTREDPARIRKLRQLMGGNPRTVALLFEVLQQGATSDFRTQLERLLDSSTSLYKERLESLPVQSQRVFDALAKRWDPASATQIAEDLRIDRGTASGQLHRLSEKGLVEKVKLPRRALGFQVRERFFNIWCLMRSGRRSRQRLRWLMEAFDLFFDLERLRFEAQRLAASMPTADHTALVHHMEVAGALWRRLPEPVERAALVESLLDSVKRLDPGAGPLMLEASDITDLQSQLSTPEALRLITKATDAGLADDALLSHGFGLLRRERFFTAARDLARLVLKKQPDSPLALNELVSASILAMDLEGIEPAIERLLRVAPKEPLPFELAINAYYSLGRIDRAGEVLEEALSIFPDDPALLWTSATFRVVKIKDWPTFGSLLDRDRLLLPLHANNGFTALFVGGARAKVRDLGGPVEYLLSSEEEGRIPWPTARVLLLLLVAFGFGDEVRRAVDGSLREDFKSFRLVLAAINGEHEVVASLSPELASSLQKIASEVADFREELKS